MSETISPEEILNLRDFKRELFHLYWEKFGVFYLHVMPHPGLIIGKRGLVGAEKESGVVLVFGDKAVKFLESKSEYLYADLQFGASWESTTIPWDAVFRIYDKFQNSASQLRFLQIEPSLPESNPTKSQRAEGKEISDDGKVIRVDFGGKKKE